MYPQRTDYHVLLTTSVLFMILITGCAGAGGSTTDGGSSDIATPVNETEKQALAEPNSTPPPAITTPSRPAGLDSTLHQLVIAEDRTQFAQQRGLDIRDDTVLVTIEVTPDNQLPQSIPIDVKTRSANKILAYVAIEDLTTLAQNEAIRTVRVPETGNADTNRADQLTPTHIRLPR